MPSLIPGYEYDIFISYRQKDNMSSPDRSGYGKHISDGWVTEFVANLKMELEVTIKEKISVYFDENPYDGILDVHEVKESLSAKLKCLIFIPIISQTYCDTTSYAWNNEFLIFKQLANADQFGLKVKLRNGNVASRIIPVRIHEIDSQDSSLLLNEMGGPLRSIDFIFTTPGVNRPLRANEDHANDNRNKTYYRDQINKVANSIKEIIASIKSPIEPGSKILLEKTLPSSLKDSKWGKRIFAFGVVVAALWLIGYYLVKNDLIFNSTITGRTTIAVIPFKAIGGEEESQYFADGMTDVIASNLSVFPELHVKSRTSVEKYKDSPKTLSEIADELSVLYILEGSAQKFGDNIRIIVQLIDTRTDAHVWSKRFDKKFENVFEIQNQISASIARSLKAKLTPDIADKINRTPTSSFEAYDLFLRAKQWSNKYTYSHNVMDLNQSISLLNQSLLSDPQFALGYAWLAGLKAVRDVDNLSVINVRDSILLLAQKALEIDSTVVEAYVVLSELYYHENDDINALRFTYKALDNISAHRFARDAQLTDSVIVSQLIQCIASIYSRIGDADRASGLYFQIQKLDSTNVEILHQKFYALAAGRHVDQLLELADRLHRLNPTDPFIDMAMIHVWLEQKDFMNLEKMYRKKESALSEQMDLLDHYILIYASALRINGKEKEAQQLAAKFEPQLSIDVYLKAQLLLFNGHYNEGLRLLESVEIGWYNLNLCAINPVFEPVKNTTGFKDFIKRNNDRIMDKSDRIYQLEKEGYLPRPEEFLTRIGSGKNWGKEIKAL
jgi:TolB-like protein